MRGTSVTLICTKVGKTLKWKKIVTSTVPVTSTLPVNRISPSECKLPTSDGRGDIASGFPRVQERMRTTGTVIAKIILVDFSDAPATKSPAEAFSMISPGPTEVFSYMSYGKLNYQMEPMLTWFRMSKPSSEYSFSTFEGHRAYIAEAVALADPHVDFSATESIVVLANPDAKKLTFGPAFTPTGGRGFTLDGKYIANAATSGHDLNVWGSIWLNHEITHTLGIVDLYASHKENPNDPYHAIFRYTGNFSYMGNLNPKSNAPGLLAWERWVLGWLDDDQIICHRQGSTTVLLQPIGGIVGVKAIVIPIGKTKAVVVESRRAEGYDTKLVKSGALVYTVDTSVESGLGPIRVFPANSDDPLRLLAPRGEGESVEVEGVRITVKKSDNSGDLVEISIGQ